MNGYSLPEVLVVIAVVGIVSAVSIPRTMEAVDGSRVRGAAYFVASRIALTRMQAVHRQANVALRFVAEEGGYEMRSYADGNRNGVRTVEIAAGVDPPILSAERLDQLFPGARFGFIEGATLVDGTPVAIDADPIRVGTSNMLAFSPMGTCTPGTVYIRGRGRTQYAVVVLGATGRSRVLRFDVGVGSWRDVQ
jgi:prepilin-type N-terminal cleavage/methylation domain-containing protein